MGEAMGNTLGSQQQTTKMMKERRNGMGNIFEGIDPAVLEKLGLSEELIQHLNEAADDTFTLTVTQIAEAVKSPESFEKSRAHRSFSMTISEEMKLAIKNRRRRNAVGNLLELLSSSQKLLLVEHLQEELERIKALHMAEDSDDEGVDVSSDGSCDGDLTSSADCRVQVSSVSQGHIVCR